MRAPVVLLFCLSQTANSIAKPGFAQATMICESIDAPGRARCEVEAEVAADETIAWGDIVLVSTPPFASALRGRIGPHEATSKTASRWRWALALVARSAGRGSVAARVRLVACRNGICSGREVLVSAEITVRHG